MRTDSATFTLYNEAEAKAPQFVVRIAFDVDSLAITSHAGISGVTAGTVLEGLLAEPTVTSQRLKPDDAVAEIGSASFALIDGGSQFTTEVRERLLNDGAGLRGKLVQFYVGYEGLAFSDFRLVATQTVSSVTYSEGRYEISCLDIQRSLRADVFAPVQTTLASTVEEADTVINLTSVAGLTLVQHGTGYSDAPSAKVGYIKIKSEAIRYTAIVGTQLQGCTRGLFNTIAAKYVVDPATPAERREKVSEYIYLELPSVKLAYAVLTGVIPGNLLGETGGFEVDSNADGASDFWQNYSNTNTYTRVAGRTGGFAQRFQANGGSTPRMQNSFGTYIKPGQSFVVSAWVFAPIGTSPIISAKGYTSAGGGETVSYSNGAEAATGAWQRISRTYTSTAPGPYIRPIVGFSGTPANGTALIVDDLQLELGAEATEYTTAQGGTLPDNWHLGVAQSNVRTSDYTGIGRDLWDPQSDSVGFPLRFEGLTKTDGKRFLEKEIFLATGLFAPVYSDGVLGLRRMVNLREDAALAVTLDESNVVSCGSLQHDMRALHNSFLVNWSWNGSEFRRATAYLDSASASKHGKAETKTLDFKGLHGARHTDGVIFAMLGMLRDRYAGPPLRLDAQVLPSLNRLEVGDVVRVRLANVRDFAAGPNAANVSLDRAFEIQNVSADYRAGVSLDLFASTADAAVESPTAAVATSLPDAYYTSAGTQLSTVPGVVIGSNIMTAAPAVLTGNATLTNAGAIYYHNGDLTIAAGVNLVIAENVQLRVKGFLTVNGSINGVGRGLPGVADSGAALVYFVRFGAFYSTFFQTIPGNPGYVGTTRGHDGVLGIRQSIGSTTKVYDSRWAAIAQSKYSVAPQLLLTVSGNNLLGLPDDLRGSGGPPGGRAQIYTHTGLAMQAPVALGGTGGNGGAGLAIICRGMGFGVNGFIDLSGANTATPAGQLDASTGMTMHPGAGGPGGPGTMLVLLDGGSLSVPDLSGNKYRAKVGTATITGTPLPKIKDNYYNDSFYGTTEGTVTPSTGFEPPDFASINGLNMSGSALRIQYIPGTQTATADVDTPVLPVTALSTESAAGAIIVTMTVPPSVDAVELYASSTNDRTNATQVFEGYASVVRVRVPDGVARYFWARTRQDGVRSTWYPVSSTAGVVGTSLGGLITRGNCEAFGDFVRKNGGAVAWDSDAYSLETFTGGVFVSFQPAQSNLGVMVGLNADPNADSNYTSIDYAFYCRVDGQLHLYESGVFVANLGAYTSSTVCLIRYDGQQLQYYKDGALVRAVQVAGLSLFVDSSFQNPGAAIKYVKYGALTTAASPPWVARGNCVCTVNSITKVGGSAAFDSDCYSQKAYENGCVLSFTPGQVGSQLVMGLNSDPSTDQLRDSIDYCFYLTGGGAIAIYESGVLITASVGSYTTSTVLVLRYDGQQVQYIVDGTIVRTVQLRGAIFFMDSSFRDPGGSVRNVEFGPLTTAAAIPFITSGGCVATSNTIRKVSGGATSFDAGAYSNQAYDACVATAQCNTPSGSGNYIVFGLNTDPLTDNNESSIDYGWRFGGGSISTIVNGVATTAQTGYTTADVCTIKYDGEFVRWYLNGAEVRAVADPGKRFFFDSAFNTYGMLWNVEYKSLNTSPAVPFVVTGTASATANSIKKTANTSSSWDSQAYSVQSYEAGCYLTFQVPATTGAMMLGLNTDPTTDADFASIDYAFSIEAGGTYKFYESGVSTGSSVAFAAGSIFGIRYDGQQIQYLVNGVIVRTVANVLNKTFYFDSSLFTAGVEAKNVSFRPLTTAPTSPWVTRGFAVATATTARKIGGVTSTYDSDLYSVQGYRSGCVLSAVPDSNAGGMFLGLDDSPAGGMTQTTFEHAFYCNSTGQGLQIYESNVMVLDLGSSQFDTTTALAIVYDGQVVRYLRNGVVVREVFNPAKTFYARMALRDTGAAFKGMAFSALSGATPVPFIARTSQGMVSDTSAAKISGGTSAWDADVVSIVGYPRCYLQFKPSQTNAALVVGLNSDPYTDSNYTSIDAAWYLDASGNLFIYESGVLISAQGTYTTNTHLVITYDGTSVRYYKDNALLRTQAMSAANVFFDTSFYTPGGGINSIKFGPGTVPPRIDTGDLNTNSATEIYQTYTAGPFSQAAVNFGGELITIHNTVFTNNNVGAMAAITVTFRSKRPNFVGTEYLQIYVLENGTSLPIYASFPGSGYATQGDMTGVYFSYTVRLLAALPDNKVIRVGTFKNTFGVGYTETFADITTHVEVLKR